MSFQKNEGQVLELVTLDRGSSICVYRDFL